MMPLKPDVFQILLALDEIELHGYGIIKAVEDATEGETRLSPSPLYRRLRRLVEEGLVAESTKRPAPEYDDERRRYYRLTRLGREALALEAKRLVELAGSRRVLTLARRAESRSGR